MAETETMRKMELRILVIEDSELRAGFLSSKFSGHEVEVASEPRSAVEALKQTRYDLVFLDYDLTAAPSQMLIEKGTGVYIAKRLRETINKSTPVVVHSMNIRAAEYMVGLMENAVMIPFNRLREELERGGPTAFLERIPKEK